MPAGLTLPEALDGLAPLYDQGTPHSDPIAQLVWENIGYLIDDERRAVLFAAFAARIGLTAHQIIEAPAETLSEIAGRGGMNPMTRAERLRSIGTLTLEVCGGDLGATLRALPVAQARTVLKRFPTIGDPGADKILLFAGIAARPCLESNGLRALVRLGLCSQSSAYAPTYKAAMAVMAAQLPLDMEILKRAYLILRAHGRALCKRSEPLCAPCPLDHGCLHVLAKGL